MKKEDRHVFKFPTFGEMLKKKEEYMANIFLKLDFKDIMSCISTDTELQNKLIFRFKNFLNDSFKVNVKRNRGWTTGMMLYMLNSAVENGELIRQLEIITPIDEKYHYIFNEIFTVIASTRISEKVVNINTSLSSQLFNIIKIKLETLVNYNKIVGFNDPIDMYKFYTRGDDRYLITDNNEIINIIEGIKSGETDINDYKIVYTKI